MAPASASNRADENHPSTCLIVRCVALTYQGTSTLVDLVMDFVCVVFNVSAKQQNDGTHRQANVARS